MAVRKLFDGTDLSICAVTAVLCSLLNLPHLVVLYFFSSWKALLDDEGLTSRDLKHIIMDSKTSSSIQRYARTRCFSDVFPTADVLASLSAALFPAMPLWPTIH
jgi:hypothetical protein